MKRTDHQLAPFLFWQRKPDRLTNGAERLTLLLLLGLALTLRLLIWYWHDQYPLGGDEREYLNQALLLLQQRRYVELQFMRPPLYTGFLAASIYLFDSLIQHLRLIQAIVSTLTVIPAYGMTRTIFGPKVAFIAGLLLALNYTLAASATELLTETVFLFGLTLLLWLLALCVSSPDRSWLPILAGLTLGLLALIRSVALPLLPLGILWLVLQPYRNQRVRNRLIAATLFLIAALLVITPWTIRNYMTYGGLIIIDTTGAENLWLDNDPAGREAVKRELYALADDRAGRQQLATQRGIAAIITNPEYVLTKAWAETTKFFALQQFDDLRDRPAIWVSPIEVWLRLLLGDATWLVLLLGGTIGLWLSPRQAIDLRWIVAPWALYTFLTAIVFHVELRYRLPLYPALLPYAAWLLATASSQATRGTMVPLRLVPALLTVLSVIALTLLHRPYLQESGMLITKHVALWQAEQALARTDASAARLAATTALRSDDRSVLARVALARADLLAQQPDAALEQLTTAERAIAAHPHPHLLRGALLRNQGADQAARAELAYETASLEDLQAWAWRIFPTIAPAPTHLILGNGLDLGHIRGFYATEAAGFRWTRQSAQVRLAAPRSPAILTIRVAPGRPSAIAPVPLTIHASGITQRVLLQPGWQTISVPISPATTTSEAIIITIESSTFRPRDSDRSSPDNRELGIMVAWVEIVTS